MNEWILCPAIKQVLEAFSEPKTPKQVEKELGIKKLKLKPFVEKGLLTSLNPMARKSRFYVPTSKARRLLGLPDPRDNVHENWDLKGWIMASPRQRLVVLKVTDSKKRTSEDLRERASKVNPRLTRISTKGILKELINRGLIETELRDRKRYYWISDRGRSIVERKYELVDSVR